MFLLGVVLGLQSKIKDGADYVRLDPALSEASQLLPVKAGAALWEAQDEFFLCFDGGGGWWACLAKMKKSLSLCCFLEATSLLCIFLDVHCKII